MNASAIWLRRVRTAREHRERIEALRDDAQSFLTLAVTDARRAGVSVADVAAEAGLSRQGVYDLIGSGDAPGAGPDDERGRTARYWLVGAGTGEDPFVPPRDDWQRRHKEWTDEHGDVHMFGRRPRISPGDLLVAHAVGSARHYGENRIFQIKQVISEPEESHHPHWGWQVRVRDLVGVPHIRHAPTLSDIDVHPRSVRRQSHIRLSTEQGQRAEALIRERAE